MRYLVMVLIFLITLVGCSDNNNQKTASSTTTSTPDFMDVCASHEYNLYLNGQYDENDFEQQIDDFIKAQQMAGKHYSDTGVLVTIPIIIHSVWKDSSEIVTDEQAKEQIDILNKCFRGLNKDEEEDVPKEFLSLKADMQIEFCLAKITRTKTNEPFFTFYDGVKFTRKDGMNSYQNDRYLNIWVCELEGLLGYAQFPIRPFSRLNEDPITDGVVIDYEHFGKRGMLKGKTAVHEIGHWLNLRHIWGDSYGPNPDDYVDDTPVQDWYHRGCPDKIFTEGSRDMVVNYMDYTRCMSMFTKGQKERTLAALRLWRKDFWKEKCNCSSLTDMTIPGSE